MNKVFYVTTPLYYANAALHIGHAYSTVACDVLKRWHELFGRPVFFLTGMDEHGEKISGSAQARGLAPQEWVDRLAAEAKELWKFLGISYDDFIRTTEERHTKTVEFIFSKLLKTGDIYPATYEGPYCVICESFFSELQVKDAGGNCPECGCLISEVKRENAYFFRLSRYEKKLLKFYEENPDFLVPRDKANKTIDTVSRGLRDLCVTRQTVEWGIPVPEDKDKTVYVWFDALINYISAVGYSCDEEKFNEYWPADVHIVGKEIFYFHTVVWPAMLMACGLKLPGRVFGHGWWTFKSGKMSKSKGNIITPYEICKTFPADVLRFFLLREMPFGSDGAFSLQRLEARYSADLANSLGNLFQRVEVMLKKFSASATPENCSLNEALARKEEEVLEKAKGFMDGIKFYETLNVIWELIDDANKFIEQKKPWVLAKEKSGELNDVLFSLVDVMGFTANILSPFMPAKCGEMAEHLGLAISAPEIGKFPKNHKIPGGKILFPNMVGDSS
ncbi:MAG: methionine--tRNA ligase [bacterium]